MIHRKEITMINMELLIFRELISNSLWEVLAHLINFLTRYSVYVYFNNTV